MQTNKRTWAIAAVAGLLVPGMIWASSAPWDGGVPSAININCSADNACTFNVNVQAPQSALGDSVLGSSAEVTTNWTAGSFSADLGVGGNLTVTGGTSLTGNVTSTAVVTDKVTAYTAVTTSQVLCSVRNTTGADRLLGNVSLSYATSSITGGTYAFSITQSTTANTTGTVDYFAGTMVVPTNGVKNVTTSTASTVSSTSPIWYSGNYINFLQTNTTSTFSGNCRVTSY